MPLLKAEFCNKPDDEANAQLIVSAPRLLAAANRMIIVTRKDEIEEARNELIAAINEAEGFIDDSNADRLCCCGELDCEKDHTDNICPCGDVDCNRPYGHAPITETVWL
jgi:hypothetical protein